LLAFCSTVNAYSVDADTKIATLSDTFNYTFAEQMNFTIIAWYSDRVMLNYTNISIIPYSGTGNATIRNVTETMINYTLCGQNQNMNQSYANITSDMVLMYDDVPQIEAANNTNYTINATSICRTVTLIHDTTRPIVSYQGITPIDNQNISTTDAITVNVTFTELHEDTCLLNWSGMSTNYTMTIDTTNNQCSQTISNIPDGTYTYYVWLNDTAGNANTTVTRTVTYTYQQTTLTQAGGGAGGDGGGYIPPAQQTNTTNISIIEDSIATVQDTIRYVSETTPSAVRDIIDYLGSLWSTNIYDFPACNAWNSTVNTDTGQIETQCIDHKHIDGSVVIFLSALLLFIFMIWVITRLTK
jgi:hypothetical protein